MKLIRLALGIRTAHRSTDAVVLAVGTDPAALQAAIDSAPAEFARFELGCFHFQRQGRRSSGAAPSEVKEETQPITEDDGRAMLARIEELEGILTAERRAMEEERAALSVEFKRQVDGLFADIEKLRAENSDLLARLPAPAPIPPGASPIVSSETPAADEPVMGAAVVDASPVLEAPRGPSRPRRN